VCTECVYVESTMCFKTRIVQIQYCKSHITCDSISTFFLTMPGPSTYSHHCSFSLWPDTHTRVRVQYSIVLYFTFYTVLYLLEYCTVLYCVLMYCTRVLEYVLLVVRLIDREVLYKVYSTTIHTCTCTPSSAQVTLGC
jgi:hypothetical protein